MAYLWEAMKQDFGTNPGTSAAFNKQKEVYNSLGGTAKYGNYTGSTNQNVWLLSMRSSWKPAPAAAAPASNPTPQPTTPAAVPNYLDTIQQGIADQRAALGSPIQTDQQLRDSITGAVVPMTPPPVAPNMEQTFTDLRTNYGVDTLESTLNDLKAQAQDIYATQRQRTTLERGKNVALNVMEGRISEVQRQEAERLDYVNRSISFVTDTLNSSYKAIDMIMNFKNVDYTNAKNAYDTAFNQNLQVYNLFSQAKDRELNLNLQLMKMNQDTAKANLQIYIDMISKGQINYATLPADQKLQISKMEIQSGLGSGFVAGLRMDPNAAIKSITTRESGGYKYADILTLQPDGSLKVTSQQIGRVSSGGGGGSSSSSKAPTAAQAKSSLISAATTYLSAKAGSDGHVSNEVFNATKNAWMQDGGSSADFDANFARYANPEHGRDYNIDNRDKVWPGGAYDPATGKGWR